MATPTYTTETSVKDESVFAGLGLDIHIFIPQLINFAIVFLVIWFLILKPLTKKLEERKQLIDQSLDRVKEAETNYAMSKQAYQMKIDEAKQDANKIVEKAHIEAKKLSESMKQEAKGEIEALVGQAKKQIGEEKETAMHAVREESAALIATALEKILGGHLTEKRDTEVIEETLASMK